MDTKKIIQINDGIRAEKQRIQSYLMEIDDFHKEIIGKCNHELIVRMRNGKPKRVAIDWYYCPACDALYETSFDVDLTEIKDSKILDISTFPVNINQQTLDIIRNEIISNYDQYLEDCNSEKIINVLKSNTDRNVQKRVLK